MRKLHHEKTDFKTLADAWPAPLVALDQKQLDRFSGGLLNKKTLQNHISAGTGPDGLSKFGRKTAVEKYALALWMNRRANGGEV